ncbi:MAG TPA: CPBP family intramembrane glutamic endopeptidase [Vicinamibacterales bacterium]|nr:CPBP family intramembrane glutamic endopeptidase [Vicinamibacterales bacterium]
MDEALARKLRGVGPLGILAFVVIAALGPVLEPLGTVLVLAWKSASETSWRELGFVRPVSWARATILGIVCGAALKLVLKALVMPLLGADPANQTYRYLAGNSAAAATMAAYIVVASVNEETVFRGFVFERLGKLLPPSLLGKIATVLVSSAWFAAVHYVEQGVAGVEQAVMTGLTFGTIFAITHEIWIPMVAHAAYDFVAIAMIYWNIESTIAHLVFK